MIKKIFTFLVCIVFTSCKHESNESLLFNGLEGYNKFRYVGEDFIEGYSVDKIAFFKEGDQLQYVLLLDEDVDEALVNNYSLGLHVYPNKKYLPEDKRLLIWDIKPELKEMGGYKYIINSFQKPIKQVDSLVFFLYDRERYQGVIGNLIRIKNISL